MPLVSCVIPVYKAEDYIVKCLESLCKAARAAHIEDDLEIICIDDGSPDDSSEKISEFQKTTDVTIFLKRFENAGSWRARWRGVDLAQGEWLSFVDADDTVDDDYFSSFLAAMTDDVDVVVCGLRRVVAETGHVLSEELDEKRPSFDIQKRPDKLLQINSGLMNKLIRTSLVKEADVLKLTSPFWEDGALMQLVYMKAKGTLSFSGSCSYNYMVRGNTQITSLKAEKIDQILEFCKELISVVQAKGASIAFQNQLAAALFCHLGISLPHRIPNKDIGLTCRRVRAFFDQNLPGWKKNPYLSLRHARENGGNFYMLWLAHKLFLAYLMALALGFYGWIISTFKHEIKW